MILMNMLGNTRIASLTFKEIMSMVHKMSIVYKKEQGYCSFATQMTYSFAIKIQETDQ